MIINELFKSIQGEGLFIGVPTLFIRTAGCDLRCVWCDTPYALLESQGTEWSIDDIMSEAARARTGVICLTGGDPLKQADSAIALIARLTAEGYIVILETSGAYDISSLPRSKNLIISMDVKMPGSGMSQRNMLSNLSLLSERDQLKFILAGREDYDYAKHFLEEHPVKCEVVMTPVGGRDLEWLAETVLADGLRARVLPQLHKYIWGNERGR